MRRHGRRAEAARRPVGLGEALASAVVTPNVSIPRQTIAQKKAVKLQVVFDRLASCSARRRDLEREVRNTVNAARKAGATWEQIGRYLGVTDDAVAKRYGDRKPPADSRRGRELREREARERGL